MSEALQAKIAELEEALASGELTVRMGGDETTYRPVKELKSALAHFKRQAGENRLGPGTTRAVFVRD